MNYQQLSLVRKTTFEKQRMARTLNDTQMSDEDKQKEFNKIVLFLLTEWFLYVENDF